MDWAVIARGEPRSGNFIEIAETKQTLARKGNIRGRGLGGKELPEWLREYWLHWQLQRLLG